MIKNSLYVTFFLHFQVDCELLGSYHNRARILGEWKLSTGV